MIFSKLVHLIVLAAIAAAMPYPQKHSSSTSASSSSSTSNSGSGIQIVNNLGITVYLWTTTSKPGSLKAVPPGGTFTDSWSTGGTSVKMSTSKSDASVLQFEYSVSGDKLYWDLSSINLAANSRFITSGFSVTPDDSGCPSASCEPGDSKCADSYQSPADLNTHSCSSSTQYTVTLG
ncbi:hypothetical protein BDV59DRAFT_195470 [Aspergillus ambiguus]|uniref:uncharacterized protein n=1 Tax=Aspergillus ambiguus TaxID=176160 RepID=UPI003CCE5064